MVKKLIHQIDTHPNRDSLMEVLNKTQEFNQFSEESEELISIMGNTGVLRGVRDLSQIVLYTAPAANACSRRREIDS